MRNGYKDGLLGWCWWVGMLDDLKIVDMNGNEVKIGNFVIIVLIMML